MALIGSGKRPWCANPPVRGNPSCDQSLAKSACPTARISLLEVSGPASIQTYSRAVKAMSRAVRLAFVVATLTAGSPALAVPAAATPDVPAVVIQPDPAAIFPRPAVLAPNIAFWTDVFSQYSEYQSVIHS